MIVFLIIGILVVVWIVADWLYKQNRIAARTNNMTHSYDTQISQAKRYFAMSFTGEQKNSIVNFLDTAITANLEFNPANSNYIQVPSEVEDKLLDICNQELGLYDYRFRSILYPYDGNLDRMKQVISTLNDEQIEWLNQSAEECLDLFKQPKSKGHIFLYTFLRDVHNIKNNKKDLPATSKFDVQQKNKGLVELIEFAKQHKKKVCISHLTPYVFNQNSEDKISFNPQQILIDFSKQEVSLSSEICIVLGCDPAVLVNSFEKANDVEVINLSPQNYNTIVNASIMYSNNKIIVVEADFGMFVKFDNKNTWKIELS